MFEEQDTDFAYSCTSLRLQFVERITSKSLIQLAKQEY